MASSAYKNKTGLPFLFSFCLKFFNKLSENVGEAADGLLSAAEDRRFSLWRRCSPLQRAAAAAAARLITKKHLIDSGSFGGDFDRRGDKAQQAQRKEGKLNPNFSCRDWTVCVSLQVI